MKRCFVVLGYVVVLIAVLVAVDFPRGEFSVWDENFDKIFSLKSQSTPRNFSYALYNSPTNLSAPPGITVVLISGTPCGRNLPPSFVASVLPPNSVLYVPERPGWGRYTFYNWSLFSFVDDFTEFLDAMNLKKVHIISASGGGPPSLSMLKKIPHRVRSFVSLAPYGPIHEMKRNDITNTSLGALSVYQFHPALALGITWFLRQLYVFLPLGTVMDYLRPYLPIEQQKVFENYKPIVEMLFKTLPETLRQGSLPLYHECMLFINNWGFDIADISAENVPMRIVHGEKDVNVPVDHSKYICSKLRGVVCEFVPDKAHELCFDNWNQHFLWMQNIQNNNQKS